MLLDRATGFGGEDEVDDPETIVSDEQRMRRCFALAALSARDGGYPFAAIVTKKESRSRRRPTGCRRTATSPGMREPLR